MAWNLLYLPSFTHHNISEIFFSCCCMHQQFVPLYYWLVFNCMNTLQIVCSLTTKHLYGFQFLVTFSVSFCEQIFLYNLEEEFLGWCVLNFIEKHQFSKVVVPFYIPTSNIGEWYHFIFPQVIQESSDCSSSLSTLDTVCLFNISHTAGYVMGPYLCFKLHFSSD